MKTASVKEIKDELKEKSQKDLMDLCLNLSKFKKDNKELLTYLLFESSDEDAYREAVKADMDELFGDITASASYYVKKGSQKILRFVKKQIRYSKNKETEIELLIHFCEHLQDYPSAMSRNSVLRNIYSRQLVVIKKAIGTLHEDLQYDYEGRLEAIDK